MIWRDFSNSVIKRNISRRMVACLASKGVAKHLSSSTNGNKVDAGGSSMLPNIKKSCEFEQMKKKFIFPFLIK